MISSDVYGLTQNIVNHRTGIICAKKDDYVAPAVGKPINSGTALKINDYITELKIYGVGDEVLFDQAKGDVKEDTIITKKTDTLYTVRVHKSKLKTNADGFYLLPITFKVKTGNTKFKSDGYQYSNYNVSLTASTYSSISSADYSKASYAFDHLIYTNARVVTSVIN